VGWELNALLAVFSSLVAVLAVFRGRYLFHVIKRMREREAAQSTADGGTVRGGLEIALNVLGICVLVLVSTGGFVYVSVGSVPVGMRVLLVLIIVSFLVLAAARLALGDRDET